MYMHECIIQVKIVLTHSILFLIVSEPWTFIQLCWF